MPLTADRPLRLRPRDGGPRCVIEQVAQWLWRWRTQLMLVYIAIAVTVGVLIQFRILELAK